MGQHYEPDLMFLLHDVARLIRVEADKRARAHGLTRAQWALLLRLQLNPGLSQKEIADLLEVEPISVARLVDRLAAHGLVERRPDAADRRIWRLHLLPTASAVLAEVSVMRRNLADHVCGNLPPSVAEAMIAGLTRMKLNLTSATAAAGGAMQEVA